MKQIYLHIKLKFYKKIKMEEVEGRKYGRKFKKQEENEIRELANFNVKKYKKF